MKIILEYSGAAKADLIGHAAKEAHGGIVTCNALWDELTSKCYLVRLDLQYPSKITKNIIAYMLGR